MTGILSKTLVHHDPGQMPETGDHTLDVVGECAMEIGIGKRGGLLVELHVVDGQQKKGGMSRQKGALVIRPMSTASVCRAFAKVVAITRYDARKNDNKVVDFPKSLAEAILSMPDWPQIPELLGASEAAILDLDGREYSEPGYHPEIRLYLATRGKLKPVPGVAGRTIGTEGVKKLLHLLRAFPFKSESDKSAALAAIITALLRRLLPSAPFFAISAPSAGTGKSLLAEVVGIILTSRKPPMLSMGSDDAEFEKRLAGALLEGDPMVVIDNITKPFGNEPVLNQACTQETLRVRILGGSSMSNVPTNALLVATGNNLAIVGDLKRRTCLIQLDAGVERPELREDIDFDVLVEAARDRDKLIRAALDISKSYLEAGAPDVYLKREDGTQEKVKPLGSFGDWDRMVRRALIFHGMADPIASAEVLREADPDIEAMTMLFTAWVDLYGKEPQTAAKVVQDAVEYAVTQHANPELHEGVSLACSGKIDARRMGYWLRAHKNRICAGMQLVQAASTSHGKVACWEVRKV